jgi:hypothetical protein
MSEQTKQGGDAVRDVFKVGAAFVGIVLFLMVVGFMVRGGNLWATSFFRPAEIAIDRESNRQSQQYVETKQALMLNLVQDLRRLDDEIAQARATGATTVQKEALKKATLDRLEQEAQAVPADQVPPPARVVLQQNGRFI